MRAIIYGYNTETKEWIELFNRGKFWIIMTDTYYKVWKTIKVSKKYKMKTYLLFKESDKATAMLPISYKTTCSALFLTSMCDFEYASEWRVRKTILELEEIGLIGKKQNHWTRETQFLPSFIFDFPSMDTFIEHWDSMDHSHIKAISDFVIHAVSKLQDEQVLYEAQVIMEDSDTFKEFYKELKPLGIKKETFKNASDKYFNFLEEIMNEDY